MDVNLLDSENNNSVNTKDSYNTLKEFIIYPNNFNDISAVLIDLASIGPNADSQTKYDGMYKYNIMLFFQNEQGDSPYGYCNNPNCGFIEHLSIHCRWRLAR